MSKNILLLITIIICKIHSHIVNNIIKNRTQGMKHQGLILWNQTVPPKLNLFAVPYIPTSSLLACHSNLPNRFPQLRAIYHRQHRGQILMIQAIFNKQYLSLKFVGEEIRPQPTFIRRALFIIPRFLNPNPRQTFGRLILSQLSVLIFCCLLASPQVNFLQAWSILALTPKRRLVVCMVYMRTA